MNEEAFDFVLGSGCLRLGCHSLFMSTFIVIHTLPSIALSSACDNFGEKGRQNGASIDPPSLISCQTQDFLRVSVPPKVWGCSVLMHHPSPGAWELGAWAKSAQVTADGADAQAALHLNVPGCPLEGGQQVWQTTPKSPWNFFLLET